MDDKIIANSDNNVRAINRTNQSTNNVVEAESFAMNLS